MWVYMYVGALLIHVDHSSLCGDVIGQYLFKLMANAGGMDGLQHCLFEKAVLCN